MSNMIDTVIIFRILRKLTTPWEKTNAFKTGLIDKTGKILVKKNNRTPEQKKAYTILDRLVFNLKRMLSKIPGGTSPVASYVAALALLKEHVEKEANKETAQMLFERLEEHRYLPEGFNDYDLSTEEGLLDAFEDAFVKEMTSGASFGGSLSGAGTNQEINKTGLAGIDRPLNKKKNRVEKIISRRL